MFENARTINYLTDYMEASVGLPEFFLVSTCQGHR